MCDIVCNKPAIRLNERAVVGSVHASDARLGAQNLVANCELLVQDVSGMLFEELVFRQVLERVEKSYRSEMRDIEQDSTFPSNSRAAMVAQLQSHWEQGVRELQTERRRRLAGDEGRATGQGDDDEWQDPDSKESDAVGCFCVRLVAGQKGLRG